MSDTNWFFSYSAFYDAIARVAAEQNWKLVVELGVWKGASLTYLARRLPEGCVAHAVDLWEKTADAAIKDICPDDIATVYEQYQQNVAMTGTRDRIIDVRSDTAQAAEMYADRSVDFVFVDASHDRESVVRDIEAWLPKMKLGGLMAGHDIDERGVYGAVHDVYRGCSMARGAVWYVPILGLKQLVA